MFNITPINFKHFVLNIIFRFSLFIFFCCILYSCEKQSEKDNIKLWVIDQTKLASDLEKNPYLDSLALSLNKVKNDSLKINALLDLASAYYSINNLIESKNYSELALKISRRYNDKYSEAKSLYYLADSYRFTYRDSAYYYYYQAEKIYQINFDLDNVANMQYNKAYVLFYDGNYIACEVQLSNALQNLKNSKDYFLLYSCNSLLGICLEKIGDYPEALIYHNNAAQIIKKLEVSEKEKSSYKVSTAINISNLYDIQKQYDKSIINIESILNEELKANNPLSYARILSNLAYSKFQNGETAGVENMFLESIKIADSLGYDSDLLYKYIYFGEFYARQKNSADAIKYLKLAQNIADKNSNTNEMLATLKLLAEIDKSHSLEFLEKYIILSEYSQALQKKTRNKYARIEYETTKIQDANKELSRNNIIIIIVSIVLIILLLAFIVIRYIKFKNKELQFLRVQEKASEDVFNLLTEQQQKINQAKEAEKTKIAQELHDGIINTLYGIRLNLGFFNSKKDDDAVVKRKNYIEELKKVEGEIRNISHELSRNVFFDTSEFNMLLMGLVQNQEGISNTRFSYIKAEGSNWNNVSNLYKINLYRIIQEAILNVNKYAKAQNCIISFQRDNNSIRILIQDDGVGFNIAAERSGIGHNNMNSRIKNIGGTIEISSELGKGTTIEIIVDSSKVLKK